MPWPPLTRKTVSWPCFLRRAGRFAQGLQSIEALHFHRRREFSLLLQIIDGRNDVAVLPPIGQLINSSLGRRWAGGNRKSLELLRRFRRKGGAGIVLFQLPQNRFRFSLPVRLGQKIGAQQGEVFGFWIGGGQLIGSFE